MTHKNHMIILAIAPSTRGFGFAVLEGEDTLVDWGIKSVAGNKNDQSLVKTTELLAHYQPGVIVLQDVSAKGSRRSPRIRALCKRIITMVRSHKIKVSVFSQDRVRRNFFTEGKGTKHALAEIIATRFSQELGHYFPPKRRPWMSEDARMDIFEAVALAVAFQQKKAKPAETNI